MRGKLKALTITIGLKLKVSGADCQPSLNQVPRVTILQLEIPSVNRKKHEVALQLTGTSYSKETQPRCRLLFTASFKDKKYVQDVLLD